MGYARGAYSSPFARDAYRQVIEAGVPLTSADKLLDSYCDYHVDRQLRDYLLSGASGKHNLKLLIDAVVRTTFRIFLSKTRDEILESDRIDVELRTLFDSVEGSDVGAVLGKAGHSEVDHSFVLGRKASESSCVVALSVRLRAEQLLRLEHAPRLFCYIMETLERCIPLHLDFRIKFVVVSDDYSFRLGSQHSPPRLGVTSAIVNEISSSDKRVSTEVPSGADTDAQRN